MSRWPVFLLILAVLSIAAGCELPQKPGPAPAPAPDPNPETSPQARLAANLTPDGEAEVGGEQVVRLRVSNEGEGPLSGVAMRLSVAGGLTVVHVGGPARAKMDSSTVISTYGGSLTSGQHLEWTVTVETTTAGQAPIEAKIVSRSPDQAVTARTVMIVQPADDALYKVVEQMPRFPGCESGTMSQAERKQCADRKMLEYIYRNLAYPPTARSSGIEGMVVVSFVVERDGTLSGARVVRDIGGGCGTEALRIVDLMNRQGLRWTPGHQQGVPVRTRMNLPVRFKLQ